jgi:hypothetical protein
MKGAVSLGIIESRSRDSWFFATLRYPDSKMKSGEGCYTQNVDINVELEVELCFRNIPLYIFTEIYDIIFLYYQNRKLDIGINKSREHTCIRNRCYILNELSCCDRYTSANKHKLRLISWSAITILNCHGELTNIVLRFYVVKFVVPKKWGN